MRRRADELDDLDLLEPVDPGTDKELPSTSRVASIRRSRRRELPVATATGTSPRARRMRLVSVLLAIAALAQFGAAGYVVSLENDLRDLEETWHTVLAVDADRAAADRALNEVAAQFGDSPGLRHQRERLYDAAGTRFERLEVDVHELSASSDRLRSLKDAMLRAMQAARRDFRDERASARHELAMAAVSDQLAALLRRWRLSPEETTGPGARLTAAHELIEQLQRMADEPTGMTIGALARDALYVIDVDEDRVRRRELALSPDAELVPLGRWLVVVDQGVASAYLATSESLPQQWSTPADRVFPVFGGESAWLQTGAHVSRIDGEMTTLESAAVPANARLVGVTRGDRPLLSIPTRGLHVVNEEGFVEPAGSSRRGSGGAFGTNGTFAAALDDRGRILVGRLDDRFTSIPFSALRASMPPFRDLAVLP